MKALYLGCMRALTRLENAICYVGLVVCALLIVLSVINRYFLHIEIMWLNDLALYLYIPTGLCCIAVTAREDQHTAVDVFADLAIGNRPIARKVYKIFVTVLLLGIFAYFIPLALRLFRTAWTYPEWGTLVRWFNTSWNREFLVICLIVCCLHTVHILGVHLVELRALLRSRPTPEGAQP